MQLKLCLCHYLIFVRIRCILVRIVVRLSWVAQLVTRIYLGLVSHVCHL